MNDSQTECPLTGTAPLAAGSESDHLRQVRAAHGKQTPDPAVRSAIRAGSHHRKDHTPNPETAERMVKAYRDHRLRAGMGRGAKQGSTHLRLPRRQSRSAPRNSE